MWGLFALREDLHELRCCFESFQVPKAKKRMNSASMNTKRDFTKDLDLHPACLYHYTQIFPIKNVRTEK